jgi:hypothetical protein
MKLSLIDPSHTFCSSHFSINRLQKRKNVFQLRNVCETDSNSLTAFSLSLKECKCSLRYTTLHHITKKFHIIIIIYPHKSKHINGLRYCELRVFYVVDKDQFTKCFQSTKVEQWNWNAYLFPAWCLGVFFRYCVLFPLRYLFYFSFSFIFCWIYKHTNTHTKHIKHTKHTHTH